MFKGLEAKSCAVGSVTVSRFFAFLYLLVVLFRQLVSLLSEFCALLLLVIFSSSKATSAAGYSHKGRLNYVTLN